MKYFSFPNSLFIYIYIYIYVTIAKRQIVLFYIKKNIFFSNLEVELIMKKIFSSYINADHIYQTKIRKKSRIKKWFSLVFDEKSKAGKNFKIIQNTSSGLRIWKF